MMLLDILLFVVVSDRRRFMNPSEYPELSVIEHAFPEIREELMLLLEERDRIPSFAVWHASTCVSPGRPSWCSLPSGWHWKSSTP